MNKIIAFGLLTLFFLMPLLGCKPNEERPSEAAKAVKAASEQMARAEALAAGRALAAAQRAYFRPSPAQAATLEAGLAVNPAGTPNGYFTNPEGISGYFQGYNRPFNFIWSGASSERRTFDGQALQLVDGPGELILKYAGDELLLQRFKGEFKDGLWDGHGEHWIRNRETDGHNYLYYVGEFRHDRMDGRGVLINYNFGGQRSHPVQYQGELFGNTFHGQGLTTDLASGRMIYKGLWFDDQPFAGSREQWRRAQARAELYSLERQYSDVLMTDDLLITGFVNPRPGQGAMTIFPPEGAEKALVIDHLGRSHSAADMVHPGRKGENQAELMVPGISLELPLSDYPVSLTLSYDWAGQGQLLRFTAERPFGLELKHPPKADPSIARENRDVSGEIIENSPEEKPEMAGKALDDLEKEAEQ